ncbi:kinase-like protein [Fistulina hepatica ATCC 64428]|uniref:Kinase-like protein n=1 Tax=Fistulina hepatica ATCC 64428 TaxID=1128425 RepID=A0A0D6ZYN4_9AGAR|nr:kinase-like protein [Fistulina hepatica ATCC 64428]
MIEEAVRENRYVGAPVPSPIFQRPVHVTPNIVAKCIHTPDMSMSEVYMTAYASDFTTIPIPCIRRVIYLDLYAWLVMDHVKGETLDVLWPRMSWWRRLRVVWTIRGYIRQLRRIPLPNPDIPGPFNGIGVPNKCEGFYFTEDGAGPFNSYADLVAWYDLKRQITSYYEPNNNAPFPSFDASEPLTFVHGDLNMRNIIIDKDDEAWLIDFGFAGAYPPWFEYAGIVLFAGMDSVHPRSWAFFAPFMAGFYERQYRFLQRIQYAISYWVLELP